VVLLVGVLFPPDWTLPVLPLRVGVFTVELFGLVLVLLPYRVGIEFPLPGEGTYDPPRPAEPRPELS
jgi:hypothetical protein